MTTERKRKRPQKSESLTIRLDPKMRFALEFVARLRGQTITKVIERAVLEVADRSYIEDDNHNIEANWLSYWDVNDGIRAINLALDQRTHPSFEEEEMLDFVKAHWNFFAVSPDLSCLRRQNIEVLWPSMPKLIELWRETKTSDRCAVRQLMEQILEGAGLHKDSWSMQPTPKEKISHPELDEEIPF